MIIFQIFIFQYFRYSDSHLSPPIYNLLVNPKGFQYYHQRTST